MTQRMQKPCESQKWLRIQEFKKSAGKSGNSKQWDFVIVFNFTERITYEIQSEFKTRLSNY